MRTWGYIYPAPNYGKDYLYTTEELSNLLDYVYESGVKDEMAKMEAVIDKFNSLCCTSYQLTSEEVKQFKEENETMKFKIIKTIIDEERLIEECYIHEQTYHQKPYIFMNKSTLDAILEQCDWLIDETEISDGIVSTYHGYPVFQHNDLAFGEAEIR